MTPYPIHLPCTYLWIVYWNGHGLHRGGLGLAPLTRGPVGQGVAPALQALKASGLKDFLVGLESQLLGLSGGFDPGGRVKVGVVTVFGDLTVISGRIESIGILQQKGV